MTIIDFHTHAFPEKVAPRALDALSRAGGGLTSATDGTLTGLRRLLDASGISRCVVLPVATKPSQQTHINDWAARERGGGVEIFGSVHPFAPDALEELERIRALGLKGVKLHPEYQGFEADDASLFPLYRKIGRMGLICVFHAGCDVGYMPPARCAPEALARALPAFDGSPVVAAHFGGYLLWERVLDTLCGLPVLLDTAYSHSRVIVPLAKRIVEKHGARGVLFGSDAPWSDPAREMRLIDSLGLSEGEREDILHRNAERLLDCV